MKGVWTRKEDICGILLKKWDLILVCSVAESDLFPFQVKLKMPPKEQWVERWNEVIDWAQEIGRERGYHVERKQFSHAVLGKNSLPTHVIFQTPEDACAFLGRGAVYQEYKKTALLLMAAWPQLRPWVVKYPQKLLEIKPQLHTYLDVLNWFYHQQPQGLYLRELRIPNVDTKFIERNTTMLGELLDYILPAHCINAEAKDFESRYLLEKKASMIRFRILDESQRFGNLSDLTVPIHEFQKCQLHQKTFFIVENELTFLTFPAVPDSCVIFGRGYGVGMIEGADWLADKKLYYWGDIDTHGFQILSNARSIFPQIQSFLMDEGVLLSHRDYWVAEDVPTLHAPDHLNDAEFSLCCLLQSNHWGSCVRLEQERVNHTMLDQALLDMECGYVVTEQRI